MAPKRSPAEWLEADCGACGRCGRPSWRSGGAGAAPVMQLCSCATPATYDLLLGDARLTTLEEALCALVPLAAESDDLAVSVLGACERCDGGRFVFTLR